jgi:replicative DNA helicase
VQTTYDVVPERGLPASLDAERSILGAIFLDNEHFHEAAAILEAHDFAIESHRVLFRVIGEMISASHAVDIVTVAEKLTNLKLVSAVGSIA